MNPEFGVYNFADANFYTDVAYTLGATWVSANVGYLYDHTADNLLYTSGANDDTTAAIITIDLGEVRYLTMLKILNTNAEHCKIEYSLAGSVYSTLYEVTDNTDNVIQWYGDVDATSMTYLTTEDGTYITDESGNRLIVEDTQARYIKITITDTILVDHEKYIGEIYIGQQALKIESGKVINYDIKGTDERGGVVRNYLGLTKTVRVRNNYSATILVSRPSATEMSFLRSAATLGTVYDFFPSGSIYADDLDPDLKLYEIYRVEIDPDISKIYLGPGNPGYYTIRIGETYVIND